MIPVVICNEKPRPGVPLRHTLEEKLFINIFLGSFFPSIQKSIENKYDRNVDPKFILLFMAFPLSHIRAL